MTVYAAHLHIMCETKAQLLGHELPKFDASAVFGRCVDELESASELCAEAVLECLELLINLPWEKSIEVVSKINTDISLFFFFLNL